jgi:hypothetical protein
MRLRLAGACFLLFALQGSFPADSGQSLRDRYGPPIAENFLIRPGVVALASYGESGHVCEIVVSPKRLWNSTLGSERITDIIDELLPTRERGKYVIGTFVNAMCLPTMDCVGTDETWEKADIFRNGGTGEERYVRIHWRRDECDPQTDK